MDTLDQMRYAAALRREPQALKWLFTKHQPRLFSFASSFLRSQDEAKDLVQETFIAFYENCRSIKSPAAVSSWLFTTCRNKCLLAIRRNALKSRTTDLEVFSILEAELKSYPSDGGVLDNLLFEDLNTAYSNAIGKLPARCREILSMSRDKGMKYKEIASALGISERTVENEAYRGLVVLKAELKAFLPSLVPVSLFIKLLFP